MPNWPTRRKGLWPQAKAKLAAVIALSVTGAIAMTGCAQVPTDSHVHSQDISVPDPGPVFLEAFGPSLGASPRDIVDGFISAQAAGLNDNWTVAREFLTQGAADKWQASSETTVFQGDLSLSAVHQEHDPRQLEELTDQELKALKKATVKVSAKSLGTLDGQGMYTESLAESNYEANFDLVRNSEGEWRISSVRDGMLISLTNFSTTFRALSIYFLSPQNTHLVPEVHWVSRARAETYAMQALLAGPSENMRDTVHTAIPDGTRLVPDSVSIEAGVATVNLSAELRNANPAERTLLATQIHATLTRIPGIRSVDIQSNSVDISAEPDPAIQRDPTRAVGVASYPVALTDGTLSSLRNDGPVALTQVGDLSPYEVTALAIDESIVNGVFVEKQSILRRLPAPTNPTTPSTPDTETDDPETDEPETETAPELLRGSLLVDPTIDPAGWAWTADRYQLGNESGVLHAVDSLGSTTADVTVPWLRGRTILSMRISADGSRLAVVSTQDSVVQIDVAGIVRDDNMVPLSVGNPVQVGGQITGARKVVWIDEATLGVIGNAPSSEASALFSVPVSGRSEMLAYVEDVAVITSARGARSILIGTTAGKVLTRGTSGSSWSELAHDAQFVTFPG